MDRITVLDRDSLAFPPINTARHQPDGLLAAGGDLSIDRLVAAYRQGIFPWYEEGQPILWWSPDPRGVLPLSYLRVGRSLRRACRDFDIRVDHAFDQVIDACASPVRPHGWIDANVRNAYLELHRLGWAHSVETWRDGELVGGLYGVAIGAFFAGESMFHSVPNASKVALVALVDAMKVTGGALIDVQWNTPHLESMGTVEISRDDYLQLLAEAVDRPLAEVWSRPMNFSLLDD